MPATSELLQEGRYRIDQPASQNGEENVFEAYDTVRNTNVVVREIPVKLNRVATVSQRESLKQAFANQAKALTEIQHESLLPVHDFFSEIDRQFLVMEAVEGDSLGELLSKTRKPFALAEVTRWADELLDALNYLHTRKPAIIHRNVNPSNVKLGPSGKIKLLGVGVESGTDAEFAPGTGGDNENLRYSPMEKIWPGLDAASQKVITNTYDDRSERILKQPLDERSDIYSLGATLYFLITGVEPVDSIERSIEILDGKLDPLREPTKVDSKIPAEISDVLMKALEIKRENRYDSAVIMRQVLKTAITRLEENAGEQKSEQKDAFEKMQAAAPSPAFLEDQQRREAEAEQKRKNELMQRQLREAEEQRLHAERAGAERLLREKKEEADRAAADAAKVAAREESVLEIPVKADVVAYRETADVEEDELAAVLRELEEAESNPAYSNNSSSTAESKNTASAVTTFETPIDFGPQPSESIATEEDDDDIFTLSTEKTGFSLSMPAMAGGVVLVLVLAVGGWFVMSGSSENKKPEPVPGIEVAQPAPVESAPALDTIVSTQQQTEAPSPASETTGEQPITATKIASAQKAKKVEASKAEASKKKVTADDLINDN